MTNRPISQITAELGFTDWKITALQGDASTRQFFRLSHPDGGSAIVMVTPADQHASQTQFLKIARHLHHIGLSAPKPLAGAEGNGVLILEDLGQTDIAEAVGDTPEATMYPAATDVLVHIGQHAAPGGLAELTPDVAVQMLDPYFDHFAPDITDDMRQQICATLKALFTDHIGTKTSLALRDYHAQNLIWRGDRQGTDRIGLIDFQDAFLAPPEYDLISLLKDARRDVSPALYDGTLDYFCSVTKADPSETRLRCAILGVQRNLRILGIFARLAKQGKPSYLTLIPRVSAHIATDLSHPVLSDIKPLLQPHLGPTIT